MQAKVGDRLVVHGAHVDDPWRDGEILEVHGEDGGPPYLVRWTDNGHESIVFPGTRDPGRQRAGPREVASPCAPGRSTGPGRWRPPRCVLVERPDPVPGPLQVRVRVAVLRRVPHRPAPGRGRPRAAPPGTVPGHEVVGDRRPARARGAAAAPRPARRRRVAGRHRRHVPVLPLRAREPVRAPTFTGWDVDGGYAEYCLVDERFAYVLPDELDDEQAAPLLCAGIIGYRSLRRADVPPGGRLGIYGFGGSAHLTAQVALAQGLRVHVLTRGDHNRRLAVELGCHSVGGATDEPPEPLDGAIVFAPAGELVPARPARTRPRRHRGHRGHLAVGHPVAGLRSASCSTSGRCAASRRTRAPTARSSCGSRRGWACGRPPCPTPMAHADRALADLAAGAFSGAAVLHVAPAWA